MLADFLTKVLALPAGGEETPISPGEIALRTGSNVRTMIQSVTGNDWFGPNQPMVPVAPKSTTPRVWDYPFGSNLYFQPRQEPGSGPSFQQLRALADNCPVLRGVIETRKQQIGKMPWSWKIKSEPSEKKKDYKQRSEQDPRVKYLTTFFQYPDRQHSWQEWLSIILEETFVTDSVSIWPVRDDKGMVLGLCPIDGASIKPMHNTQGWRPAPPDPAYQQIIKGMPAINFTSDDLMYAPRNPRVHKFYGYSEVEQLLMIINIAIRRDISKLAYYTDGNVPEMIIQVPAAWSETQIKAFQQYTDSFKGDLQKNRRMWFVPETKGILQTKEAMLKDEYDEWLARVICYLFSVPPTPFVKQMNRATAQTAQTSALEEGLLPILQWIAARMTLLARHYMGIADVEFAFNTDQESDMQVQSTIDASDVKNGIRSVDEVREDRGLDAVGMGPCFLLPTGPIMLDQIVSGEYSAADPSQVQQQKQLGAGDELSGDQKEAIKQILAGGLKKKLRLSY